MMKILFLIIILNSCASHKSFLENSNKYYQNELYNESLIELQKGLKKYPNNPDLKIALRKSQDKIYENQLLKIRDTREAGDPLSALNQVRIADKKMEKWKIDTNINGSSFRRKELEKLFYEFKKILDSDIQKGFILKSHTQLLADKDILGFLSSYKRYEKEIISKGKKKCISLSQENNGIFYNNFIKQYCDYFQTGIDLKTDISSQLYNVQQNIINLNNEKINYYNFINNKLHNSKSKKIIFAISKLKSNYSQKESKLNKSKNYSVRESYWTTESKSYLVPQKYWANELVCNYLNKLNPCQNKRVQKSRLVTRYKKVKVKKYRTKYKTYNYSVKEYKQTMIISGQTLLSIDGKKILIPIDLIKFHKDQTHNNKYSKASVSPDPLTLKDPILWEKDLLKDINQIIGKQVNYYWKTKHCINSANSFQNNENFSRCSLIIDDHSFLDQWSKNFSGLYFKELKKLLKL